MIIDEVLTRESDNSGRIYLYADTESDTVSAYDRSAFFISQLMPECRLVEKKFPEQEMPLFMVTLELETIVEQHEFRHIEIGNDFIEMLTDPPLKESCFIGWLRKFEKFKAAQESCRSDESILGIFRLDYL